MGKFAPEGRLARQLLTHRESTDASQGAAHGHTPGVYIRSRQSSLETVS